MNKESFRNKVVAITGGSDGIGKALVNLFIQLEAKVATCGRNPDKLYDLRLIHSGKHLHTLVADVSSYNDCKNFIDTTIQVFGGIDILINNAGMNVRGALQDVKLDAVKKIMDVNFFGTLYCTKLALDSIIERKGMIIGISSIAGYRGLPGRSVYSASKFAVTGFLESIRSELKDTGVHVMWICPGFTRSNFRNLPLITKNRTKDRTLVYEEKMMSPEACAARIFRGIEKRKRTLVFPFIDKVTVLLNKLFPSWTDRLVRKFFYENGELIR